MLEERVQVVQIALAKLIQLIPPQFSRSADKMRDHLLNTAADSVTQYLLPEDQQPNHLLDPSTFNLTLQSFRSSVSQSQPREESKADEPLTEEEEIALHSKSVNIRFGNYSVMTRAGQFGFSSKLMKLLAGSDSTSPNISSLIDQGDEPSAHNKIADEWD